jgi:hypothetical protein
MVPIMSHTYSNSILSYVDWNGMSGIVRLTTESSIPSTYIISPQGSAQID